MKYFVLAAMFIACGDKSEDTGEVQSEEQDSAVQAE
jgi:hypothetical protein